jgi:WD40 repeat protein
VPAPPERRQDGGLDAFVSYSHRDAPFVRELAATLEARGYVVWIDADDIPAGAPWRQELGSGIEAADSFIFLVSPDSLTSEECAGELTRALELGKRLVPVLLHAVDTIPSGLAATQYIDATDLDIAATTAVVADAIETDHDWVREHTQWLTRALRWQTHDRQRSYLLRGNELRNAEAWLARQSERRKPAPTALQTEFVVTSRDAEKRRLRRLLAIAAVAVLVSTALAVFAFTQRSEAIAQRDRARSRALAAASVSQLEVDPELSLLLAIEAANVDETPEARDSIRRALGASHVLESMQNDGVATDVTFDEAGDVVVATTDDGPVTVVDAASWTVTHRLGTDHDIREVRLASGGDQLLTLGDDRLVRIWDIDGGDEPVVVNGDAAAFSPDGDLVATGDGDGTVKLFDADTARELVQLDVEQPVTGVEFSPDGRSILVAQGEIDAFGAPGAVTVWTPLEGESRLIGTYSQPVFSASFDAAGRRILVLGGDVTTVWDVDTGELVADLGTNMVAAFSPDGGQILTAAADGTARTWTADGQPLASLRETHAGTALDAAWNADGTLVVTAGVDLAARVWDPATGNVVAVLLGHTGAVNGAAFSPDGRTVATAGSDGDVRLWTIPRPVVMHGHELSITSVEFSADGEHLVTSSDDSTARIWDAHTGDEVLDAAGCQRFGTFSCFTLGVSAARVAELDEPERLRLTDAEFTPDGERVLTAGWDGTVQLNDSTTGEHITALTGHDGPIWHASFSDDASRVVTAGQDGTARIWDTGTGDELVVLTGHRGLVSDATFTPDGAFVATSGEDKTVRLWDAHEGNQLRTLAEGASMAGGIAISPDATLIAVPFDETVKLIATADGSVVRELRGHTGIVMATRFSPDGRLVVTGAADGTVRVWLVDDGSELGEPFVHGGAVTAVAFNPTGDRIATAVGTLTGQVADLTATVWGCEVCVPDDELLERAESNVTRALTPAERQRFLEGG